MANKFGANVYSMNPVLQEELDRLAWADYLGGVGVGLAQTAIPNAGGRLLTASGTARLLNDVINTTPASELWVRNKNKLARVVQAKAKNGAVIVLFPADHVLWSAKVADIASWLVESKKTQDKKSAFQIWILGDFSKKAQAELQAIGWEVHPAAHSKLFPPDQKP